MSHTISLPVSRYGLAGFLSLMMTLLMFLALFETIKAPSSTLILLPKVRPPVYKPLVPPPLPQEPTPRKKLEFKYDGTPVIVRPPITTVPPVDKQTPPEWDRKYIGDDFGKGPPPPLEGELMVVVKVPPLYPISAQARGIEGYVVVEYNVTAYGTASDIRIIEASPEKIFDQLSIDAVAKFKFKPRVVNGTPVETRGLRNKFVFELDN